MEALMLDLPAGLSGQLHICSWDDPVIDQIGFDPRSNYVERFWLRTLGPSTTWLLRHIASCFEESPEGFDLPLLDTARALGLGGEGRNSPFIRAIARSCQFEMARPLGDGVLSVRRKLPPLNRRQVSRLPEGTQLDHAHAYEQHRLRLMQKNQKSPHQPSSVAPSIASLSMATGS